MFTGVLKERRVAFGLCLVAAAAALVGLGCVSQIMLSGLRHVPHRGMKPVLDKRAHARRELECLDCHAGAKTEPKAGMPERKLCMLCHVEFKEAAEKLAPGGPIFDEEGQPKWKIRNAMPEGVAFSHAVHAKKHGCPECHGDLAHGEYGLVDLASKFENCERCHTKDEGEGNCKRCHSSIDDSSRPHSHSLRWSNTHGRRVLDLGGMARVDKACYSCHNQGKCISCHKTEKPRDHTVLWSRGVHGLVADIERERCTTCHTEDVCVRCHLGKSPRLPTWTLPPHDPAVWTSWVDCSLCHGNLRAHVGFSDKCLFCHR